MRTKNRLKAVFRFEAIDTNSRGDYSDMDRSKELSHESARFVAESLFDQILRLEKTKGEYREFFSKEREKVQTHQKPDFSSWHRLSESQYHYGGGMHAPPF